MKTNYEFQILRGTDAHVQKVLNQWKHQFKLKIHSMQVSGSEVVVLLIRIPKGGGS